MSNMYNYINLFLLVPDHNLSCKKFYFKFCNNEHYIMDVNYIILGTIISKASLQK